MTLKYREAFHDALGQSKLTACYSIDLSDCFRFYDDADAKRYIEHRRAVALRELERGIGVEVSKRAEHKEEFSFVTLRQRLQATVFVFSPEDLDRLIQATVERARADLSWRRSVRPTYPSAR